MLITFLVTFFTVSCNGGSAGDFEATGGAGLGKESIVNDATDRKIIYNVSIGMDADDVASAKNAVAEKLSALGGYVENSSERFSDGKCDYSELTLRIPTEKLDEFLASVEANGSISYKRVSSTDITTSYVSAEAKREALIERKAQLEQLLTEAGITTSEKLNVINEISSVSSEIKSLDLMINGYDSKLAFSTVILDIDRAPSVFEVVLGVVFGAIPAIVVVGIVLLVIFRRRKYRKAKNEQVTF